MRRSGLYALSPPRGASLPQTAFTFCTDWFKIFLLGSGYAGFGKKAELLAWK